MVVQLLPGDLLIFPSATITHGNLPLLDRPNQVRYSLTSYTSGALFQWVANKGNLVKYAGRRPATADWKEGWDLYSTLEELEDAFSLNHSE